MNIDKMVDRDFGISPLTLSRLFQRKADYYNSELVSQLISQLYILLPCYGIACITLIQQETYQLLLINWKNKKTASSMLIPG